MSHCKKCGCTTPCGCQDTALTTIPLTQDSATCPTPQVCSEFTYSGCIIYNGPEICDINIIPGMTLNQVIQALSLFVSDPDCITTTSHSPFVQVVTTTTTTITIGWALVAGAEFYVVSYLDDTQSPAVWVDSSQLSATTSQYVITGLECGTIYNIKVSALFDSPDDPPPQCDSLIICVTTLDC